MWFTRSFVVAPVALDDSTPYRAEVRASFGAFGRNENGYAQAIDRYRDFAGNFRCQRKSSEPGSVEFRWNWNLNGAYSNLKLNCWVATTSFTGCEMHLYCLMAAITES